jgi:hypothetical protein
MHYCHLCITLDPIMVENPLVVLCLAEKTLVEVEWQVQLMRLGLFISLVHEWNV